MSGNGVDYPNFAVLKGRRGEQGLFYNVNKLGGSKGSRTTQVAPLGAITSKFKAFNPTLTNFREHSDFTGYPSLHERITDRQTALRTAHRLQSAGATVPFELLQQF